MPRRVPVSSEQVQWLRDVHGQLGYDQMAERIGCCVDTLKRILARNDIEHFEAAKYEPRRASDFKMWTRPCITCGCTKKRPKNHYYCRSCRSKMGYSE